MFLNPAKQTLAELIAQSSAIDHYPFIQRTIYKQNNLNVKKIDSKL